MREWLGQQRRLLKRGGYAALVLVMPQWGCWFDIMSQTFMHGSKVNLQARRPAHLLVGGIQIAEIRANAQISVIYQSRTYANINGATIVASDSMMNFGVSTPSFPHVIFSFGTAPEYDP